jgi:hypothetical protein
VLLGTGEPDRDVSRLESFMNRSKEVVPHHAEINRRRSRSANAAAIASAL